MVAIRVIALPLVPYSREKSIVFTTLMGTYVHRDHGAHPSLKENIMMKFILASACLVAASFGGFFAIAGFIQVASVFVALMGVATFVFAFA